VHLRGDDGAEVEVGPFDAARAIDREQLVARVDEALIAADWAASPGETRGKSFGPPVAVSSRALCQGDADVAWV
jgi:hypothetical protein